MLRISRNDGRHYRVFSEDVNQMVAPNIAGGCLEFDPMEEYNGKRIYYSLGNFMFDQNFSFATEHGLAVNIELNKDKII